jgi:hypothetical protein
MLLRQHRPSFPLNYPDTWKATVFFNNLDCKLEKKRACDSLFLDFPGNNEKPLRAKQLYQEKVNKR